MGNNVENNEIKTKSTSSETTAENASDNGVNNSGDNGENSKKSALKTIAAIAACIVVVGICIVVAISFTGKKDYDTVTVTTTAPASTTVSAQFGLSGTQSASDGGISIVSNETLPSEFDAYRFVKQGYELNRVFAVKSFSSDKDISASALVQYAFCYLYAGNDTLVDMSVSTMTYKEASESDIRAKITELFGACTSDITRADLYNSSKGTFEMWQPNYKADVYAGANITSTVENAYTIAITYYNDSQKKEEAASVILTVKKNANGYYLASMS